MTARARACSLDRRVTALSLFSHSHPTSRFVVTDLHAIDLARAHNDHTAPRTARHSQTMSSPSSGATTSGSDTVHDLRSCGGHTSRASSKCNSKMNSGTMCTRAAKIFPDGLLPMCKIHSHVEINSSIFQAIAACGQPCLRLTKADPPFHLCTLHDKCTDTLPCHLLGLPVELRLMIFRYIFPNEVTVNKMYRFYRNRVSSSSNVDKSVLMLNRQLYEEASSVLYGETVFHATISAESIFYMGTRWNQSSKFDSPFNSSTYNFPSGPAKKVRNLHIILEMLYGMTRLDGIAVEELMLVMFRNTIRKFIKLVNGMTGFSSIPCDALIQY